MKNISLLFAFQCILLSIFVLDFNHVLVSCDGTAAVATGLAGGALSEIMKQMLAQAPVKILSLVQLGLLARLLRQRRNRLAAPGVDGIDNDRDGLVDEEDEWTLDTNKKNVMIFMGKHNIQVSNHGIKKAEEEGEGEDSGEEGAEEDGEEENGDSDEDDSYSDDNQYKKDIYKKSKVSKGNYGEDDDSDKYKKNKKTKSNKKTYKKKKTKVHYEGDEDEAEDEYDGPNHKPTFISYANSNNKPTQTLLPWLKSFVQNNEKSATNVGHKDSNIMALPNGFPIGGSKLEHFKKRSDDKLEDVLEFEPSESEISELLSNPQVIELLYKLNESLANETEGEPEAEDLKRTKRQLKHNVHNLTAEDSRHPKQSRHLSNQSLRAKNFSTSVPNYFKNSVTYSSSFNPITGLKPSPNRVPNDLNSQSSAKSVDQFQPMESTKTYKLGDYMTFKPVAQMPPKYKTSSSNSEPSFGEMETTDDDEYEGPDGPSDEGSHYSQKGGSEYGNEGSEYGHEESEYGQKGSKYGTDFPTEMFGRPAGIHGNINSMAYGGAGTLSEGMSPNLPVMDLSYWNKIIKKTQKKKNKKKKYMTTEAPPTDESDEGEEEEEEEEEEVEPSKKIHTTIQIIKAGSKAGNIGINSDEERSSRGWVRGLPGFRQLFGRR